MDAMANWSFGSLISLATTGAEQNLRAANSAAACMVAFSDFKAVWILMCVMAHVGPMATCLLLFAARKSRAVKRLRR
jgi:hypothetical protein